MISIYSRYRWSESFLDEGHTVLGLRATLDFESLTDTMLHVVEDGDTLESLADKYYAGMANPAMLYWAIADFQPEPILDPTLKLQAGTKLLIPSPAVVQGFLLGTDESDVIY